MNTDSKKHLIVLKGSDYKGRCRWKKKEGGFTIIQYGKWTLLHDTLRIKFGTGRGKLTSYVYNNNELIGFRKDNAVYKRKTQ